MSQKKEKEKRKQASLGVIREESVNKIRDRYPEVMEKQAILLGQPETQGRYMHVDFAHFNMLLSTVKFKECSTMMDACRELWYHFWPYLSRLLVTAHELESHRNDLQRTLQDEYKEHDLILKNFADVETERKIMVKFLEKHGLAGSYREFKMEFQKEIADR